MHTVSPPENSVVRRLAIALAALLSLGAARSAQAAPQYEAIYNFPGDEDGFSPSGKLDMDEDGAIYGATLSGGKACPSGSGSCGGVIYQLSRPAPGKTAWRYKTLYSFKGGPDGAYPEGGVSREQGGALIGSTKYGGHLDCTEPHGWGCGTVFRLTPPAGASKRWTKETLRRFSGDDGSFPDGPPLRRYGLDALLGTTPKGGPSNGGLLYGLIEREGAAAPADSGATAAAQASLQFLKFYGYVYSTEGGEPNKRPVACPAFSDYRRADSSARRSTCDCPFGFNGKTCCAPYPSSLSCAKAGADLAIFEPAAAAKPFAGKGSLFGATAAGGDDDCVNSFGQGCGTVFEFVETGAGRFKHEVRYSFLGGEDGYFPNSPVTVGPDGSLYGTTVFGGKTCPAETSRGCGVVYRVSPPEKGSTAWTETVLYRFAGGEDGARPAGGVEFGADGALYGATTYGGACAASATRGCGTIFKLTPPKKADKPWTEEIVHRFEVSGGGPNGPILFDNDGALYGTTPYEVFRISF